MLNVTIDSRDNSCSNAESWVSYFGDDWFERNKEDLGKNDMVVPLLDSLGVDLKGRNVLEVGCANGWRLKLLRERYGCEIYGVEPSEEAVKAAGEPKIVQGVVERIPTNDEAFDVVILGHVMWALNVDQWFPAVAETTRVLRDGGLLVVSDNCAPFSFKREYKYNREEGWTSYQMYHNWQSLWLSHPGFRKIAENYARGANVHVVALEKNFLKALPVFLES